MQWSRIRPIRILVILIGIFAVPACYQLVRWQRSATLEFEKHSKVLQRWRSEAVPLSIQRKEPIAPTGSGEAWGHYQSALSAARSIAGGWSWTPDVAEHGRLLIQCQGILRDLRAALSVSRITFPIASNDRMFQRLEILGGVHGISSALLRVARGYHAQSNDMESIDTLLLVLGTCADIRRDSDAGMLSAQWSQEVELQALEQVRIVLSGHSLTSSGLEASYAAYRTLHSSRSSLRENLETEDLLLRAQILTQEKQSNSMAPFGGRPAWQFAFSARLERAAALRTIESVCRGLEEIDKLPTSDWLRQIDSTIPSVGSVTVPLLQIRRTYEQEIRAQCLWRQLMLALAIARFEAKLGIKPATLGELLPECLQELPVCPHTGGQYQYANENTWCSGNPECKWMVAPRRANPSR